MRPDVHPRTGQPPAKPSAPRSGTKRQATETSSRGPSGVRSTRTSCCPRRPPRGRTSRPPSESWPYRASGTAGRGGGDRDRVERRPLRDAERAVPDADLDALVPGAREGVSRTPRERRHALDRHDVGGELGEDGGAW